MSLLAIGVFVAILVWVCALSASTNPVTTEPDLTVVNDIDAAKFLDVELDCFIELRTKLLIPFRRDKECRMVFKKSDILAVKNRLDFMRRNGFWDTP